jgi:putative tryptophan/tyrosine transport system substrate-binding protein
LAVQRRGRWAARAQQPAMQVIGFLNGVSFEGPFAARQRVAILEGLRELGFVEGQNVGIEYRSAGGQYDLLPGLAADLVHQGVTIIIATGSTNSPQAAKAATSTIPIVFAVGADPVGTGLVNNLRRPEANLTGVTFNTAALSPKRLEIATELVPGGSSVGYLKNSTNTFDTDQAELMSAARSLGRQLAVFGASTEYEINAAFQSMTEQRIGVLIVSTDAFFAERRNQIIALATKHAIPTIYATSQFAEAGGLISYSVDTGSLHKQAGIYAGRILKGEKPVDLPVILPTKFELVLNLQTTKTLGLKVPQTLLVAADRVIE